jgi:hypothetical protein
MFVFLGKKHNLRGLMMIAVTTFVRRHVDQLKKVALKNISKFFY